MESNLIKEIKKDIIDLKEAEIEGLLYILLNTENLTNADFIRLSGVPKEILRQFKLRISEILENVDDDIIKLTAQGRQRLSKIKPKQYLWSIVSYTDPHVENEILKIRNENKNKPLRNFDQFFSDAKTSFSKVKILEEKGLIKQKRIALIGDDDLVSIVLGLMRAEYIDITVFDIDQNILNLIEKLKEDYDFKSINTVKYDVLDPVPQLFQNAFDLVIIDPPYTKTGVETFLNRGVKMLKKHESYEGSYIALFFGNSFKSPEKFIKVQELINKFNLVIEDKINKFSRYYGAESIGNASSIYILKNTPSTTGIDLDMSGTSLYTFESKKEDHFPYVDHVVIKLFNVPSYIVGSRREVLKKFESFCRMHGLKIKDRKISEFGKGGITAAFILSTSNLLVHTWPEFNAVHVDLITCRPANDKNSMPNTLSSLFKTSKIEFKIVE